MQSTKDILSQYMTDTSLSASQRKSLQNALTNRQTPQRHIPKQYQPSRFSNPFDARPSWGPKKLHHQIDKRLYESQQAPRYSKEELCKREEEKARLQGIPKLKAKSGPVKSRRPPIVGKEETFGDGRFGECVREIEERKEWLEKMRVLNPEIAKEEEMNIKNQIQSLMQEMKEIDAKKRRMHP